MTKPKKYIKDNGVMKMNPEFKKWQQSHGQATTTVPNIQQAMPVVTNMEDHAALNEVGAFPFAESTNATFEMMQEPEISMQAGMNPGTMVNEVSAILNKYEVPIGLTNKMMMLSEFDYLEFIIDDSGSMRAPTDSNDKVTGKQLTRWQEAHLRLKEQVEILAYVPFNAIEVCFLNDKRRLVLVRNGRDPKTFLIDAYNQIDQAFATVVVKYTTPALEKLRESLQRGQGKSVARYFFGDGRPDGGEKAQDLIVKLLSNRPNAVQNPITFVSCTNEDEEVEWMKDAEEVVPYCSEADDFNDEMAEVMRDQGAALPYTQGFHIVAQLVAAMNPDDLDAMDESVPFSKTTLDNLLGIQHNDETYRHYFNCFVQAQRNRKVERDNRGRPKAADQLKKTQNWEPHYQDFLRAPVAKDITAVKQFKRNLLAAPAQQKKGFMGQLFK